MPAPWERYREQLMNAGNAPSALPNPGVPDGGLIIKGNIPLDPASQPTTYEFTEDGIRYETLVPTIGKDGKPYPDAAQQYVKSKQFFGKFDTNDNAQKWLAAQSGPWAKYNQPQPTAPQPGGANTKEDSAARGLPPLMMPNYWGQEMGARWKAPPLAQQAQDVGDAVLGIPTGVASGTLGLPGNVEGVGRLLLAPTGVSQETALPTSSQVADSLAGPATRGSAGGRAIGELLSPLALIKGAPAATKGATNVGGTLAQSGLGLTTGAGGESIRQAYQAGKQGGSAAATFLDHMRNGSDVSDDAVRMAKDAVDELRRQRSADYKAGIGTSIKGVQAVLDFAPVDAAIQNVAGIKTFKGQSLSGVADKARKRITEVVEEWKKLDPAEYHTPEGLDALKQKIGDIIYEGEFASLKPNSPASTIVNNAYNAVKAQIVKQAPSYGRVMKDYEDASKEIREIETSLSLGSKASVDTSLRKLQSILRNNANTNYGARVKSGEALSANQPDLMPALAGQALNSRTPRGIQSGIAGLGSLGGYSLGGLPGAIGYAAASSPRLVGEAAFGLGRASGAVSDALKNAGVVRGANAVPGVAGNLDPRLLAMMTPEILAQLLLQTSAPAQ